MNNQTHYQTLGVSQTATSDEIKRAYRKMARQYHPDVNKSSDAEEKMKAINSAYDVLSDPQKRADYDRFGQYQQGYQQTYQQNYQNQQYSQSFESMDDLFAYIFAQQYRQQQGNQQYYQQNQQQYQQRYYQYQRPVQASFIGKIIRFFYMFMMIRFVLWLFFPFI